jgi:HAD superfamily hydrolase (TIGR01509 family)
VTCELLIFDCDGVLVDSEPIAERVLADAAGRLGWSVSLEEAARVFPKGGTLAECVATIEARIGKPVPADFTETFRAALDGALAAEAKPVPGVVEAIAAIDVPMCVASNGPPAKMETSLKAIGLFARFSGRLFSAYTLQRFKPLPDVFLHAAETLGVEPARCVVVEDSLPGIQAAVAAGMRVFGYSRDADEQQAFASAGAEPLADMAALPGLLL